jgi:16S rRNA (cytidine1402-2'-O)-methyltransferase
MTNESAALYVVATPVGNLADLTPRAQSVLREVAWIAAEDTRHTQGLLAHFGIATRLFSAHEHNEAAAAARIVEHLVGGESVALVSDAGTPAISDPGARIVAAVHAAGHPVIPLPGACAATLALSAAGFDAAHWLFYGFLPVKPVARRGAFEALRDRTDSACAVVFYEAPHRIVDTVNDLASVFSSAQRELLIAREVTKRFETIHRLPVSEAPAWLAADPDRVRGEFVLVLGPSMIMVDSSETDAEAERVLRLLLADGLPVKQAAALTAAITGIAKKPLYARALAIRREG